MTIPQEIYDYITGEEDYHPHATIMEEGHYGNWVYILLEGRAVVKKKGAGGRQIKLCTLTEGDIFGEKAVLQWGNQARSASVIADGPVRVGLLDTERLSKDLESMSSQFRLLISTLFKRLQNTTDMMASI